MTGHPSPKHTDWPQSAIFTVGHSTLPIERFIRLLQTYSIGRLVDIRTIPSSHHNPQFNGTALAARLAAVHLEYAHFPALGVLRHPRRVSGEKWFVSQKMTVRRCQ